MDCEQKLLHGMMCSVFQRGGITQGSLSVLETLKNQWKLKTLCKEVSPKSEWEGSEVTQSHGAHQQATRQNSKLLQRNECVFALSVYVEILWLGSNVSLGAPHPPEAASKNWGWKDCIHLACPSCWSQMLGFVTPLSSIKSGLSLARLGRLVVLSSLSCPVCSAAQGCELLRVSTAAPALLGLCIQWVGAPEAAGRKMDNVSSFPQWGRCRGLMTECAIAL